MEIDGPFAEADSQEVNTIGAHSGRETPNVSTLDLADGIDRVIESGCRADLYGDQCLTIGCQEIQFAVIKLEVRTADDQTVTCEKPGC